MPTSSPVREEAVSASDAVLRNASPDEIRSVFALQQAHRWTIAARTASQRIAVLERLRKAILDSRQELDDAMWLDLHKSPVEAEMSEIHTVLVEIRHTIRHLKRWMRPTRASTPLALFGTRSVVRPEAKGVVLVIAPWNYPFNLLINPLVAAISAGNTVIAKPSEKTPHVSRYIGRLIARVFPPEEVSVFEGDAEVAKTLLDLPFDHICFTGSTSLGRIIMAAAARHLTPVTLELGGKSPAIVDSSADLDAAASRIAWGRFINAGQTCIAPDYVLVHASVQEAFLEKCRAAIASMYGATDAERKQSADFCRIVDAPAFDRLSGLIDDAVARGAVVVAGGQCDASERYVAPTILTNVPADADVMADEIFGPILPVVAFRSIDEAIGIVRSRPKPLALYVFARDRRVVDHVIASTTAGGTAVNNAVIQFIHPDLPFGGVGESGIGSYHGEAGFRTFSHGRAILRQGWPALFSNYFPPYTDRVRKLVGAATMWFSWPATTRKRASSSGTARPR